MTDMKNSIMKNPLTCLALSVTPALAATTDFDTAITMGFAVMVILVASSMINFMLKNKTTDENRLATTILVVAGVTSVVQMILAAFAPAFSANMGLYAAVTAAIALTTRQAELTKEGNSLGEVVKITAWIGLNLIGIMVMAGVLRELLGSASIGGRELAFLANYKISAMTKAPGAYIALAMVIALETFSAKKEKKEDK